jgi:hypothetical protein
MPGRSAGKVTCQNVAQSVAPRLWAASSIAANVTAAQHGGHFLLVVGKWDSAIDAERLKAAVLLRFQTESRDYRLGLSGPELRHLLQRSYEAGHRVDEKDWLNLEKMAAQMLVLPPDEAVLRDPGFDAAKTF